MPEKQIVVGIDGCKAGWLAAVHNGSSYATYVFSSIEELSRSLPAAALVLIDMPIGLAGNNISRNVEVELRKALSHRKSSVFTPPCREAVHAWPEGHAEVQRINCDTLCKGVSLQAFHICRKIAEIDSWLQAQPQWRDCVYEAHPEYAFATLNTPSARQILRDGTTVYPAMKHGKSSRAGRKERLDLLTSIDADLQLASDSARECFLRKEVALDDILDALCLCVSARLAHETGRMKLLIDAPETDAAGLTMNIAAYVI